MYRKKNPQEKFFYRQKFDTGGKRGSFLPDLLLYAALILFAFLPLGFSLSAHANSDREKAFVVAQREGCVNVCVYYSRGVLKKP